MGACVSSPANAGRKRRSKEGARGRNDVLPKQESGGGGGGTLFVPRSRKNSRIITILPDPVGDNIREKYLFSKELGRGEFGVTYLCTHVETGERFACKTISKSKLRREVDIEDVRREVEIMRHLPQHPNIVSFEEAYEDKEAVYLVMELCEGGELFDRIVAKGHYTERAAADVVKTILNIVQVCHEHGVAHRDLKPENFLYANKNEDAPLKAIDFGLSVFFEPGQRFNEIVGSPYYMAPEVLKRNYGPEVDVWSAGVILYILLCGVPPFWAETDGGIAHAIVRGVIDFERDPWPKVSQEARNLVKRMLDQNPHNRLTIKEVLEHPWFRKVNKIHNVSLGANVMMRIKQFSLMNKFKKKALRVVADNLPDEHVENIRKVFHMMDTDHNGSLSFEELKNGLPKLGHSITDSDVRLMIDAADFDGNGMLDSGEFLTISIHIHKMGSDEQLRLAFDVFDKNRSGYIEFDELAEALFEENEAGSKNEKVIHDIMFDADLDKDGRISYEEFKTMMNKGMEWKMGSRQYSKAMLNALSFRLFKDQSTRGPLSGPLSGPWSGPFSGPLSSTLKC